MLCFLLLLRSGEPPAADELDASWTAVLGWAHANALSWGSDIVFTYGPLGFLVPTASYVPQAFGYFWLGQLALAALSASFLLWLLRELHAPHRLVLIVAVGVAFVWIPGDVIGLFLVAAMLPFAVKGTADRSRPRAFARLVAVLSIGVLLVLIKVSHLLPVLIAVLAIAGVVGRARGWAMAVGVILAFLLLLLGTWLLLGQRATDLPLYLLHARDLTLGYTAAMSHGEGPALDARAFAGLALAGCFLLLRVVASRRNFEDLAAMLVTLAVLGLAWRTLVTRLVADKLIVFYAVATLLVLLALAIGRPGPNQRALGVLVAATLVIAAIVNSPIPTSELLRDVAPAHIARNVAAIARHDDLVADKDTQFEHARTQHALPLIAAAVGDRSVDLMSYSQGLLVLNGFNYHPRPVFQGYAAYTTGLARLNERYLLGGAAPQVVLIRAQAMDGALFASDDPLSFAAVLRRYRPLVAESDLLALEQLPGSAPPPVSPPLASAWHPARLGESVAIPPRRPGHLTLAFVDIAVGRSGRLRALALREARLKIEVTSRAGVVHPARINRGNLASGFVIDPLVVDTADIARALMDVPDNEHTGQPASFVITAVDPGEAPLFRNDYSVAFTHVPTQPRLPPPDASTLDLVFPGFGRAPSAQWGNIQVRDAHGRRGLMMFPPAGLSFPLTKGRYAVSLRAGIMPTPGGEATCVGSDGVRVVLRTTAKGVANRIAERPFALSDRLADGAEPVDWTATVELDSDARLDLEVDDGGAGNFTCDLAFIGDVVVDRTTPLTAADRAGSSP